MAEKATVFNHDILMCVDMLDRFAVELNRSQSSGVSGMLPHDVTRMRTYTAALMQLHDWIMAQPILDLPETHPREFPLEEKPEIVNVESESVNMLNRLVDAMRTELINSQSARYASTLISHDSKRYVDTVSKMDSFISNYVESTTPLDLPESSPEEKMTGHGSRGVNP